MTPSQRTLVLGGARSGKSSHAESLVAADASVTYVATGRRDPADADWQARIDEHRRRRPNSWRTVESSEDLPSTLRGPLDGIVVVDDLGTWLTGVIDDRRAWDSPRGTIGPDADDLVDAIAHCRRPLVMVSPEVGLGVIPETRSGRLFRDELGALNGRIAAECDTVVLVVAGLPLTVKSSSVTKGLL